MKKLLAGTLIAASVLCIGGTGVLAAPGRGQNFIDSDGNGICDNYGTGNAGSGNTGAGNTPGNAGTGNCVGRQEGTGRHAGNGCHAGFRGGRNR